MISWLRHWPAAVRAASALGLGFLTALGFAPYGWWPLTIVGVAGLSVLVAAARRVWGAIGIGYLYGVGLLLLGVGWMQVIFVQAMLGLVAVEAVFYAALAALLRWSRQARWWPLTSAAAWVVVEAVFSRAPFGGFGWMRLGYAMVDSPLGWGYAVFGVAGVTFFCALVGQGIAWLAERPSRWRAVVASGVGAVIVATSAAGLAVAAGPQDGQVQVGWVQGGAPGGGVYGLGPARTITNHQLDETVRLAERISAGELPAPDFVVWPENSTDMDPFHDAATGQAVRAAAVAVGVPLLVGVILDGPGVYERQTASLWWLPDAEVTARYIKRAIVPFGEWVPMRDLLQPLIPELAYVGPQSVAGTEPGVMSVHTASGDPIELGVIVCYDVAFDGVVADTVTHGAQVIVVQSSNAMYQGTGQIDQQFAITRVRAMELRREILVVTTSGVSGLIEPDGSVAWRTTDHTAASGVVTMPERTGVTFAAGYGWAVEFGLAIVGLLGMVWGSFYGRMTRSQRESGAEHG